MADLYNETMSLDCQRGRCDDCPDNASADPFDGSCACVCHVPDVRQSDEADALAVAFYARWDA